RRRDQLPAFPRRRESNSPMTEPTPFAMTSITRPGNVPTTRLGTPRSRSRFRRWWPFYLMAAPGLLFFVVFHYVPIWEAKVAFEQVRIIPPNIWVGLKNFQVLFSSVVFWQVLANTVIISAMKLAFVFPVPIAVAL